jgi:hypothetical protein
MLHQALDATASEATAATTHAATAISALLGQTKAVPLTRTEVLASVDVHTYHAAGTEKVCNGATYAG